MSFVPTEVISKLGTLSQAEADNLPFGAVKIDDKGVVQIYNTWESDMAAVRKEDAIGQNFFKDVAPCTNNRMVFGAFEEGVRRGELDSEFPYTFTYRMEPTDVEIHMLRDPASASNWFFVTTA